jgi:hypothetical protein
MVKQSLFRRGFLLSAMMGWQIVRKTCDLGALQLGFLKAF